jgi:antitoxin component YwqK of YwqJK toxin-antitoxin module
MLRSSPHPESARRGPVLLLVAGALLLAVLTLFWRRNPPPSAATAGPDAVSVPLDQLEKRGERLYLPGQQIPFSGWVTELHADGALKLKTAVADGQWEGESEGWTPDGVLVLRERFHHGSPDGPRSTWHPNGRKKSEGRLVAGKQQGEYRQWNEQGVLLVEALFSEGRPDGLSLAWYPSGYLQAEALMQAGEVQSRHFYPDGERRDATLLAAAAGPRP